MLKPTLLRKTQFAFALLNIALFSVSATADYNYPYTDSWAATVSEGLIRAPTGDPVIRRSITINKLSGTAGAPIEFNLYMQPAPSSLIILIPGLGDTVTGSTPNYLADLFFRAGHHVLIVPNDFTPEFAIGASRSGVVGIPQDDAADMRNLIRQIINAAIVDQHLQITKIKLIGYSLGALQSAFVAAQDAALAATDSAKINIATTVLVNSPVDLWYGINALDTIGALKNTVPLLTKVDLDAKEGDILFKELTLPPSDPNYFLTLNGTILPTSDVNLEYVVGANFLSSLQRVNAGVTSFQNYMQTIVMPTLIGVSGAPLTVQALAAQQSLTTLSSFLNQNKSIFILHNQDDFLLQPSDLQFLSTTFGSRLILYPLGGHIGNLWFAQNQADMLRLLAD